MLTEAPKFITKPLWIRFTATFFLVLAAFGANSLLWLIVDRPISSVLFMFAIGVSAWFCGFRAGIFATILSGLLLDYFFITPIHEILGDRDEIVRFVLFLIEGSAISWLLDAQRRATDEIAHSREQLQALSNHLHTVRESEQKRIALEIHDELGQALTGVKMGVHWLNRQISEKNGNLKTNEITGRIDELMATIDSSVSTVRRIATELRPSVLDDFGLVAAIEWQIQEFERLSGLPCEFRADPCDLEVDAEISTSVFRIFQEAMTNIARHSNASTVEVDLGMAEGELFLIVADDGRGIRPEDMQNKRSLGILGMKERAKLAGGTIAIVPANGGGTEVKLRVPLNLKKL